MKRSLWIVILPVVMIFSAFPSEMNGQVRWMVGGKLGMSLVTGGGSTDAGLQIGPTAEALLTKNMGIATEFTINTQPGTPVVWANYFKYYFDIPQSDIVPYADAGFFLDFVTGGPYFGILFGGGAHFPIAKNLYIPADVQLGPIFTTPSRFTMAFTSGIRYIIPN